MTEQQEIAHAIQEAQKLSASEPWNAVIVIGVSKNGRSIIGAGSEREVLGILECLEDLRERFAREIEIARLRS
jgi:hypothetical protein